MTRADLSALELRIPPLVVLAIAGVVMALISQLVPGAGVVVPQATVSCVLLAALGALISGLAVASFRRANTTVNPLNPDASTTFVVTGIYRYSRNPMYLAFLIWLAAWGIWLENWLSGLFIPIYAAYLQRFQIIPEERILATRFPDQFARYCSEVRRWL
jgi:protein-S-isoprenylcysteine O-methyltransferase Ste14